MLHARGLAGCLLCALLLAALARAQNFPDKNITLLHAYSPGSSSSVTLRAIGEAATKTLGKKIVVEDKPGAGGALAPTYMLKMGKPDGYTLSQLAQPILAAAIQKVEFERERFTWIIRIVDYTYALVVRNEAQGAASRARQLRESQPGKLTYATSASALPCTW